MRYFSVASGIEAATVAWHPLGWEPVGFAQFDPEHDYRRGPDFASALLNIHYPDVPNYGDMTKFQEWPDAAFNVLVGGTPCQSFSVAGLRKGLADPRGNLALTFLAIVDRYRPNWVVWENVPGVLSADSHDAPDPRPPAVDLDGDDGPVDGTEIVVEDEYDADEIHAFACLLAGFSDLGYHGAYGTLDAQYFGLAQRRKRVFAVFHSGSWTRGAAVLFDRSSLSGDPAPSREARQVAPTVPSRRTAGGGLGTDFDCDGGLIPCAFDARQSNVITYGNQAGPLDTHGHSIAIAFSAKDHGADAGDIAPTLRAGGHTSSHANGGVMPAVAYRVHGENSGAMQGAGAANVADPVEVARALDTQGGYAANQGGNVVLGPAVPEPSMAVRRLTPRECERLQGFPDDYTLIPYRGKPAADGPRYKALGNSMAVPVMRWIGERIQMVEAL